MRAGFTDTRGRPSTAPAVRGGNDPPPWPAWPPTGRSAKKVPPSYPPQGRRRRQDRPIDMPSWASFWPFFGSVVLSLRGLVLVWGVRRAVKNAVVPADIIRANAAIVLAPANRAILGTDPDNLPAADPLDLPPMPEWRPDACLTSLRAIWPESSARIWLVGALFSASPARTSRGRSVTSVQTDIDRSMLRGARIRANVGCSYLRISRPMAVAEIVYRTRVWSSRFSHGSALLGSCAIPQAVVRKSILIDECGPGRLTCRLLPGPSDKSRIWPTSSRAKWTAAAFPVRPTLPT